MHEAANKHILYLGYDIQIWSITESSDVEWIAWVDNDPVESKAQIVWTW